jgi:hypothetical protein
MVTRRVGWQRAANRCVCDAPYGVWVLVTDVVTSNRHLFAR